MIEVAGLTKSFGSKVALDAVSFRVGEGQVTGFLGPNGAGKTTAMRLILGLDRPSSGTALIDGRPLQDHPDPMRQVGALLGSRFAHPRRSAFDHLRFVAATHRIPTRRVFEVLEETGLDSVADQRVGGFSLGMTQRLGIATALLGSPRALILDEPVNGLDLDGVRWFRGLCERYAADGAAVFLSSHLMSEVELVATHIIVLGRGRVIADAPLAELRTSDTAVLVETAQLVDLARELRAVGARVDEIDVRRGRVVGLAANEVGAAALRAQVVLERLDVETRSLEDSYRALTDGEQEFESAPAAEPVTHQ